MNFFKDTWKVIDLYFKTNNYFITKHHIDSWNDFLINKLKNTINVLNPIVILKTPDDGTIKHEINIYIGGRKGDDIFLTKPTIYENGKQRILYPNEARLRDLTYQADLYANIEIDYITIQKDKEPIIETDFKENVKIGAIPIMLHSKLCVLNNQSKEILREMGECPYDQGGYFIIDGKEKVIVAQERIALNKIFINKSKDDKYSYEGLVRSTSEDNPLFPKTIWMYVAKDELKKKKLREPNSIWLACPNIKKEIPLFVLFRALGVESDKEIISYIIHDMEDVNNKKLIEFLRYSIVQANNVYTQEEAYKYISQYVDYNDINKVKHVLINDIFPNVGQSFKNKAMFLGHVTNKLVKTCLGIIQESDRDNYVYKRVDISGFLIGNLFRDYYNQFRNTIRSKIDSQYLYGAWRSNKILNKLITSANQHIIFQSDIIEQGFRKSLKGGWGKSMIEEQQDSDNVKEGLVQDLARISYLGFISHLRRVNTPIDPTSKIVAPHRLHPSQYGIMCPVESPDGGGIGLIKHFSVLCNITFDTDPKIIMNILKELGIITIENVNNYMLLNNIKILINNTWVGVYSEDKANEIYKLFKLLKRNGIINIYTSISWDIINREINISTEAGRCCRPVYVVFKNDILIKPYLTGEIKMINWDNLINGKLDIKEKNIENLLKNENLIKLLEENQSPIEYIDVDETNNSFIAMDYTELNKSKFYTHCEIHPSVMFGVVTQNIPFSNHNQAPRNIFFGAQGKQAVGTYTTSFNNRIDTMAYVLNYPQKPLVNTRYMEYLHNNILCGGENLIVAISTYTGYNMEDSIIVNKNSIERGMFNMTYFKNVIDKEDDNNKTGEKIRFVNPLKLLEQGKEVKSIKFANYKKTLDDNGYPKLNTYIKENDAVIGKSMIKTFTQQEKVNNSIFETKVEKEEYTDKTMVADKTLSGIVDKVVLYNDSEGKKTCKIRLRKTRIPELGDKMASRMGQKGVCGMILPSEDMPFSNQGIVPDIIINPHAIPSRMTIGHLLDCVLSKKCVYDGSIIDGTPFNHYDYEDTYSELESKFGLEKYGNEIMYNGFTGEQIQTEIFFGPTYYQRLKHQVADKINYRRTGPLTMISRQPTKGRGNNGGLRIGEMEKDSILSHGMMAFLKESLMERSDTYSFDIEDHSGNIAITNKSTKLFKPTNPNITNYKTLKTPYAFKLLLQEINAMGIKSILSTDTIEDDNQDYDDAELGDFELNESDSD